jgi:DNA repair exonuclease SbcCD nuclease subunit
MVRFLHSGDWQLGMTRHFLSTDAQARYSEARLDAVRKIAELARKEDCLFVVVSGDVFESNHLDRQVVVRALDALAAFNVPVYLLPGNHDPVNAGSIYRSSTFREHCPKQVVVLESSGIVRVPGSNVELVGAPWDSKHQLADLVARVCTELTPSDRVVRVVVAHGAVDEGSRNPDDPTLIRVEAAEDAIRRGCVHYVALGDRHSATEVGSTGRIWYSGTPLVTDYTEIEPNEVLLVELDQKSVSVQKRIVGSWRFIRKSFDVNTRAEVEAVRSWLEDLPDKRCTVVKLSFVGTLSLTHKAGLDAVLEHSKDLFAAVEAWEGHTELRVLPDEDDLRDLALSGFAKEATAELGSLASFAGPEASVAQDALGLLYRLASRQP